MQMHEGFAEGYGVAFCPEWSKSAEKADAGRQTLILGSGTFCPFEVPDPEIGRMRNHLGNSTKKQPANYLLLFIHIIFTGCE